MPTIDELLVSAVDPSLTSTIEIERGKMMKRGLDLTNGNITRAIDYVAYNDKEFKDELNHILVNNRYKRSLKYDMWADQAKDTEYFKREYGTRASGTFDTSTTPGGGNELQTTVGLVQSRVEELGLVVKEVETYSVSDGNYKIPVFSQNATAGFVAGGANATNLGTTLEGGLNAVTIAPQRIAGYIPVLKEYLVKINPQNVQRLMDKLSESLARGYDLNILTGAGTGVLPTGIAQNATAATAGANDLDTFRIAAANVAKDALGGLRPLVAFMNTASWLKFAQLSVANIAYREAINVDSYSIHGVRVVVTDVLPVSSGTATVLIGYPKHYAWGVAQQPSILIDNYSQAISGTQNAIIDAFAHGLPLFNNSFAKFTISGLLS